MEKVLDYLDNLLNDNDTLVIANSGGPDSMCLLNLLCKIKDNKNIKIIVAHVNHKMRLESEEEALFVKEFCESNNLIFEYTEINEKIKNNIEKVFRDKRYKFFQELVLKYKAKYLMTAHHGDDLVETIMMKIVRGSSIEGYSGFKKEVKYANYLLVRPLITVTKEDILKYMDNNNYKYYIDKSNFSREYTRNRYRMDLLPFLKHENENVHLKFLKFSEEIQNMNNYFNKYIKEIIDNIKEENGINIKKILKYEDYIIKKVIENELSLKYKDDLDLINDNNIFLIIDLLKSKKSNLVIDLPKGFKAVKDYNYFKIIYNIESVNYKYILKDEVKVPTGVIKHIKNSDSTSNNIIRLNSKDIALPIIIRSRMNGDKITIKNMNGTKKVKDIYIDEKISINKRKLLPIVTDSKNNILWLPGVKKSKFDVETKGIYDIILLYEEDINEY